jgi:hypothetical protein
MQLRPSTSSRPELVVSARASRVGDPLDPTNRLGVIGIFGRGRCLFGLPVEGRWLSRHKIVHDQDGFYLGDPDGNVVGMAGVYVNRILGARWTEDTRRLAG